MSMVGSLVLYGPQFFSQIAMSMVLTLVLYGLPDIMSMALTLVLYGLPDSYEHGPYRQ